MRLARAVCALGAFAALAGFANAQADAQTASAYLHKARLALEANPDLEYVPNSLLVKFRDAASEGERARARSMVSSVLIRSFAIVPGLEQIGHPGGTELATQLLRMLPSVEFVEPDYVLRADVIPNDAAFSQLWGMHNTGQSGGTVDADIDAPEAWDTFTGSPNMVIAVIDTGIDYNHPDLAANSWINPGEIAGNGVDDDGNGFIDDTRGWDFVSGDNNPIDDNNHGTHVAGTIGGVGNNGIGVAGVNWTCKLMALKFLNASGSGSTSAAISCLNYAKAKGVLITNNSWGGGGFSSSLQTAIENSKPGIFVAAAGNSGLNNDSTPHYPSSYTNDNIIAVASIDRFGNQSSFSNFGATSVDLGAPGSSIYSTVRNSAYATFNGTSMATPHVAGVVGLVTALNPTWTYLQIRSRVLSTVVASSAMAGITTTGGVLNAANAVGAAPPNTPPTVTISSPANGTTVTEGTSVTFVGSAMDTQDGDISVNLVWTSSLMGQIGTGASFSRSDLTVGTHTVTASVTDSGNLTGSASISLTIQSVAAIPPAPCGLTAIRLSNDVARVTYTDNSSNEDGFTIERQKRVGGVWGSSTLINVGENVTLLDDPAGDGRFRYRARAFNLSGSSAWTGWASIRL